MKRSALISKALLAAALAACALFGPEFAKADDGVICPAIYPCNEAGELLDIFNIPTDPCVIKYTAQCKSVRQKNAESCSAMSDDYNQLQLTVEAQKRKLARLQRQVRNLKKGSK